MKKILKYFILTFIASSTLFSCKDDNEVVCNMIFTMITVEIEGEQLTGYYTIREATQDTLRLEQGVLFENNYPILTDAEFNLFEPLSVEDFRFLGFIDDEKVVDEAYRIGVDRCHVFKESGVSKVVLEDN